MRKSVFLFSQLFFMSLLMTATLGSFAQAESPLFEETGRGFRARAWQFALQTNYFQATANYTPGGGQYASLASGSSYNLMTFDFGARWTPVKNLGIYASIQVANAESKDTIDTRRNSTFTQAVIGMDYRFFSSSRWQLYPDFSVTVPFEKIDPLRDEVLNHEGAMEGSLRLIAQARWGLFEPFAFAGFTYRDENRANLIPYGLGAELRFSNLILGGDVRGYQTATKDSSSLNDTQRLNMVARNGGALKFNSKDPALMETNFWLKGEISDDLSYKLGAGTSITGTNMAAGWNAFLAISYNFETVGTTRSSPVKASEDDETDRFEEETTDGVNQNLFRRPVPATAPPAAAQQKAEEKKKLQKEMDQTEFQIELKTTKKKKRQK